MNDQRELSRLPGRLNNFSSLRVVFAALVILSHSFELIDGNRSRELLTRLFGTISFGVFAVDGFFIVSGYLITQSYLNSSIPNYVIKRILRIYPAFIVAFLVSLGLGYLSLSGQPPIGAGMSHNLFQMFFCFRRLWTTRTPPLTMPHSTAQCGRFRTNFIATCC